MALFNAITTWIIIHLLKLYNYYKVFDQPTSTPVHFIFRQKIYIKYKKQSFGRNNGLNF